MAAGPVIFAYDGSAAARRALHDAARLLAPQPALVVSVWEPTVTPLGTVDPFAEVAPIDVRSAREVDQAEAAAARTLAEQGAVLLRESGMPARALAVVDEVTVAATLVRLAREHEARALVVGAQGRSGIRQLLLGSTSREVVYRAPCPVLVRGPAGVG